MERVAERSGAVEKVPQSAAWRTQEAVSCPDSTLNRMRHAFHPFLPSKPIIEAMWTEFSMRFKPTRLASKFDL
jgi:hypothetical protein